MPHIFRTLLPAALVLLHVLQAADVMLGVRVRLVRLESVGVDKPVVDGEARVVHLGAPELPGHDPAASGAPGVGDDLVPALVEHVAAVVVVAQDAQPRLLLDSLAGVDGFEGPRELARRRDLVGGDQTALRVEPGPIEVVACIQDVVGRVLLRTDCHLSSHLLLGDVVDALHEVLLRPLVCRCWPMGSENAAPIADDEHLVRPLLLVAHGRQLNAVEVGREQRRVRRLEALLAIVGEARLLRPLPVAAKLELHP
mmetsp:Transcript_47375/g.119367  ORF Transcript_47375/g.119367 Transcript_47375/m.119367 type:complete len:254 (-) Transcript_47375:1369-2130(-)